LVAERERIARELHKFTVYRLFGIGLTLQALSLKGGDPAVSVHLNECVQELDRAISELRGLVFNLDASHVYEQRRPKTPDSNPVPLFAKVWTIRLHERSLRPAWPTKECSSR
jgi:hypothetical protein